MNVSQLQQAVASAIAPLQDQRWCFIADLVDWNASSKFGRGVVRDLDSSTQFPITMELWRYGGAHPSPLKRGITVEVQGKLTWNDRYGLSLAVDRLRPIHKSDRPQQTTSVFARQRATVAAAPKLIEVVAPAGGLAALSDFKLTLDVPASVRLLWHQVAMTGTQAVAGLVTLITRIGHGNADTLVLIRGGGSYSDLEVWNHPNVLKTLSSAAVPIITGIGHSTDRLNSDHVVAHSASTPTAAALYLNRLYPSHKPSLDRPGTR